MNITVKVLDTAKKEPISGATVWVNEKKITQTDANGNFTLKNINPNDLINVTFIGYGDSFALASDFPKTAYLDNSGYVLNEVVIKNVFKKTNWLLWLALGIGTTAIVAYKYNQDHKKSIVKAKI